MYWSWRLRRASGGENARAKKQAPAAAVRRGEERRSGDVPAEAFEVVVRVPARFDAVALRRLIDVVRS